MFRYNVRAWELYGHTVVSLAVLCDDRPDWRPSHFAYGDWGSETALRFPVVKVLDYAEAEEALVQHANPFAQIVRAHLKAQATRRDRLPPTAAANSPTSGKSRPASGSPAPSTASTR